MTVSPAHSYKALALQKGVSVKLVHKVLELTSTSVLRHKPPIYSLGHIAHYSDVPYLRLRSILENRNDAYEAFCISKRGGGKRFLHAPNEHLKQCQRWINSAILKEERPHAACYSFHSGGSIFECAKMHCGARWLIKADIERFFESIHERDVYEVFCRFGYTPLVAHELARLCTRPPNHVLKQNPIREASFRQKRSNCGPYEKDRFFARLPQGAPTSPALSNLVFYRNDELIASLAKEHDLVYTRYADDICLSSSSRKFNRDDAESVIRSIYRILKKSGFSPNKRKLKIIPPGARKIVLGLNVTGLDPKLSRDFKQRINSHLRGIDRFGLVAHRTHRGFDSILGMTDHIIGLLSFAKSVEPDFSERKITEFKRILEKTGMDIY